MPPTRLSSGVIGTTPLPVSIPNDLVGGLLLAFGGWRRPLPFSATYDPEGAPAAVAMTRIDASVVTQTPTGLADPDHAVHATAFYDADPTPSPSAVPFAGGVSILDATTGETLKGYLVAAGVDLANPIAQVVVNNGSGTTATTTLAVGDDRSYVHFVYGLGATDGSAAPSGSVGLLDVDTFAFQGERMAMGHGVPSATWTFATTRAWVAVAVALRGVSGYVCDPPANTVAQGAQDSLPRGGRGTCQKTSRCDHVHEHGLVSADGTNYHDASHVSIEDTAGDFAATDVEGALAELQARAEAHLVAADPHTGYQKESEKGAASGYASLGADSLVPQDQLGTGTQDGTKFLRDDGTWQAPSGGASELDDLTDVTLSSPADADRLRFDGSVWRNSDLHWEPMMGTDGLVMLDSAGGPSMHEVSH